MSKDKTDLSLLFPDYIQGRLSEKDMARVEDALKADPDLAADFEFQKKISETLKSDKRVSEPGELGWAKLSRALDKESQVEAPPQRQYWRYAALALAALSLGQGVFITGQLSQKDDEARYVTVSQAPVNDPLLTLAFVPTATEQSIRILLKSVDANITAGPSALGLYDISFTSESARQEAMIILQTQTEIVESVSLK